MKEGAHVKFLPMFYKYCIASLWKDAAMALMWDLEFLGWRERLFAVGEHLIMPAS